MQGATSLAVTKLDVLSYLKRIPVCTGYVDKDGKAYDTFPLGVELDEAKQP